MGNTDEKNIVVNRGQPPANPYGSGGGLPASRDGWTFGFGGKGGGEGGRPGTLSSSKRRRLRLQDKRRREWEAQQRAEIARLEAEAAVRAQAEAQAKAIADAAEQARIQAEAAAHRNAQIVEQARAAQAEAAARAERARIVAAHQQALETLPHSYASLKAELDKKYSDAVISLSATLAAETQSTSDLAELTGQPLLEAILLQKTQINYLISQKTEFSKNKETSAHLFVGSDPLAITSEQYKAILGARSTSAEQAYQVHQAWAQAYKDALDARLHKRAIQQLMQSSSELSAQYAEHAVLNQQKNNELLVAKHIADAHRLWTVVAGHTAPATNVPTVADKAKVVAERLFTRQAARALGRALPQLALLYPTELANSDLGPSILATAASQVGVSRDVDLHFIASKKGTVDVTHRMAFEEVEGELAHAWIKADGVTVGAQVRVRSFTYNSATKRYEFTRDGDTKPSLIWTPAVSPENKSTVLPVEAPDTYPYAGAPLSPVSGSFEEYPTYDIEDIDDLILVFPDESGLDPVYVMFKSPRYLPGVVAGVGGEADPNWQGRAMTGLGAPVPAVIADALRDRNYAEFGSLRRAIWREFSKHPELTRNMDDTNVQLISKGLAPFAPKTERKGGRVKFEIHHIHPISQGGDVYNIDNLMFNTPLNHDKIHQHTHQNEANYE
ncbi:MULTISPECIES: S-type pyocin domain-containing protein [unclassified Pseudomonas]|uniref:S-type pyocin domain-containing protein n=1 Tax=unclassified Pseudomonas TaxID=196821 RepID=UPI000D3B94F3|nr:MULTISPECIES: S-type pyocin domain-containing protein [unclassified Pseudomonas]RAU48712.1 hypothetical protein DBP26_004160 [Pseudomonas sp. RIT 409]RAU54028.1 hypothetical protein DBY65_010905 [Pseudomonas sp. RIT 412]